MNKDTTVHEGTPFAPVPPGHHCTATDAELSEAMGRRPLAASYATRPVNPDYYKRVVLTGMSNSAIVRLVYDGASVSIPAEMGEPREDQLQGGELEKLAELAGRVCYDSLGKGRSSADFHKHIAEVGHLSVYEHCAFTVQLEIEAGVSHVNAYLLPILECLNRPGMYSWVTLHPVGDAMRLKLRVTINLRTLLEWKNRTVHHPNTFTGNGLLLLPALGNIGRKLAPMVVPSVLDFAPTMKFSQVEPETDHEKWVSLYIGSVSRGLTHELVRHGDSTAISQRSTRYVDESESPWITHPLVERRIEHISAGGDVPAAYLHIEDDAVNGADLLSHARRVYTQLVADLEKWLIARGVDKTTARKQARGAARGYLGNALSSELIFSATVAQWRWIISQRASAAADAEIRGMACEAVKVLQKSRYADRFKDITLAPSPDGIGEIAVFA